MTCCWKACIRSRQKRTYAAIAGPLGSARPEDLLSPPSEISSEKGEEVQRLMEAIYQFQELPAKVFITYAIGTRSEDAEGYGPAIYFVAAIAKLLYDNGIPCLCDLMLGTKHDHTIRRKFFNAQIGHLSDCQLLIVVLTDALFLCKDSLRDIYAAQAAKIQMFPLRFEHPIPNQTTPWPQIERHELEFLLMTSTVERGFCKVNSIPSPPYTIQQEPAVLKDVLVDLRDILGCQSSEQAAKDGSMAESRSKRIPRKSATQEDFQQAQSNGSPNKTESDMTITSSNASDPDNAHNAPLKNTRGDLRGSRSLGRHLSCSKSVSPSSSSFSPKWSSEASSKRRTRKDKGLKTTGARSRTTTALKHGRTTTAQAEAVKNCSSLGSRPSSVGRERRTRLHVEPCTVGRVLSDGVCREHSGSRLPRPRGSPSRHHLEGEEQQQRRQVPAAKVQKAPSPRGSARKSQSPRAQAPDKQTDDEDLLRETQAALQLQKVERGRQARKRYKVIKVPVAVDVEGVTESQGHTFRF